MDVEKERGEMDKKTKKETITLRGHHLKNLYEYLFGERQLALDPVMDIEYGSGFTKKLEEFLATIIEDKGASIVLTKSFDDVCSFCKKERDFSCHTIGEDKATIEFYGLELDRKYTVKQITDVLKKKGRYPFISFTPFFD